MAHKILLVDDEPNIVKTLTFRLKSNNYEVVSASDGEAGLRAVYEHSPDLMILDIMMPKMDGFEVCQRLRADLRFKKLPILMLTAKAQAIDRIWGERIGATEYLVKPFDSNELLDKIAKYLTERDAEKKKVDETSGGG